MVLLPCNVTDQFSCELSVLCDLRRLVVFTCRFFEQIPVVSTPSPFSSLGCRHSHRHAHNDTRTKCTQSAMCSYIIGRNGTFLVVSLLCTGCSGHGRLDRNSSLFPSFSLPSCVSVFVYWGHRIRLCTVTFRSPVLLSCWP